jgi:F-type H+-transporting ATPase subunit b
MTWLAAEENPEGLRLFIPEPSEIFWSTIIVIIIGVVFYFFVMPKFTKVLDQRAEKIQGNIAQAQDKLNQADSKLQQYDDQLQNAKMDAAKIIQDANQHANKLKEDTETRAESEYRLKMAAAQKQIDDDVLAARLKLRKDLGDIVVDLAAKVLEQKFDDRDVQAQNINNFISDIATDSVTSVVAGSGVAVGAAAGAGSAAGASSTNLLSETVAGAVTETATESEKVPTSATAKNKKIAVKATPTAAKTKAVKEAETNSLADSVTGAVTKTETKTAADSVTETEDPA